MPKTATAMAKVKETFIATLRTGRSPSFSAKKAGMGRATAYSERAKDREFAKQWEDAVQEGVDVLDDTAFIRATKGKSDVMLGLLLRGRRPEVYAQQRVEPPRTNHSARAEHRRGAQGS
jgi:hypothetical protein